MSKQTSRVDIGGPVGSGKTALIDALCKRMREHNNFAAVTNDIYTQEDAQFLVRSQALAPELIIGVVTGGCPHTAIREDASINLVAVERLCQRFPVLDLVLVESGGNNLSTTFSPALSDLTIYVIDVAAGDKVPRNGGPGIIKSDLLGINKIDLAPHAGASLKVTERDARKMRGGARSCSPTSRPARASTRWRISSARPACWMSPERRAIEWTKSVRAGCRPRELVRRQRIAHRRR